MPKPGRKGIARVYHAAHYSRKGLSAAWQNEAAFRQECTLAMLLLPVACWLGNGVAQQAILVATLLLVLITELLNSAVEAIVDQVTDQYAELAGRAKDMGSAAVMLSLLLVVVVWAGVAYEKFF